MISKDIEVYVSEFPTHEIIEEIENLIESKAIEGYHTSEYIEKMKPVIEEMKSKLSEINLFILGY